MDVRGIFARYKVKKNDDKIFDIIRGKYVHCTPEEIIRQKTIKFLLQKLEVPKSKIVVERSLSTLGVSNSKKRIDIGIFDDENLIMGVIECKAPLAYNEEEAHLQAQDYLFELKTRYFFVTDGYIFNGYYHDTTQFIRLENIPKYDEWYNYPTLL